MESVHLAVWVHSLDPFLIRFPETWPLAGIRWYGLSYVMGFLTASWLLRQYIKYRKGPLLVGEEGPLMTYLIFSVLLGGRLGYCLLYDNQRFLQKPWILFEVSNGGVSGMASHGGFVGVCLGLCLFAWRYKKNLWQLADCVVSIAPPGLFFGRLANFINGELWGKVTHASWAVVFPQSAPYPGYPVFLLPGRHPSQLYEAILEGFLLFLYLQLRYWRGSFKPGVLTAEFLILYSLLRIFAECFREPDAGLFFGLSRGIFYSIMTALVGLMLYLWRRFWATAPHELK